jgi:branched-chain amino acid transport system ATP-binding protein
MTVASAQAPVSTAEEILRVEAITKRYGGLTAVDGVGLSVGRGESLGVIGPNGAGKSTFIGLVSGALAPSAGSVHLAGQDVTRLGAATRTHLGIGRTYQIPRPFSRMTVLENLVVAARHARGRETVAEGRRRCAEILDRTALADVAHAEAGGLPLLRRKRLELARALALRPRLLLLDEIGAGLVEHETAELITLIRQLRAEVDGLVLVEHVMDVVTACCDRAAVLDFGRLIAEGPTRQVLADPTVAAVYLGTASDAHAEPTAPPAPRRPVTTIGASEPRRPWLEIRDLHVGFGGVRALRGVDLDIRAGEVVALLGANGAGKTTLARTVSGMVRPAKGTITAGGRRIDGMSPDRVAGIGIAHCMEGRRIFSTLTVEENLRLAVRPADKAATGDRLASVYEVFPALRERCDDPGTAMSGGQQQMLAIGRALMQAPQLVMFDEISLGLAPVAVDRLYEALAAIRESGVAMLLVEQNLERGLSLADRAYVLSHGHIRLDGTPDQIRSHPALRALYVGESGNEHERKDPP